MNALPQNPDLGPARVAAHSRFVQRVGRRYADALPLLPEGSPSAEHLRAALDALRAQGRPLEGCLRVLRQLVLERLAVLDCEQQAPLATVTQCLVPLKAANAASSSATSGPMMYWPWSSTRWMRASMSAFSAAYCAFKSVNCKLRPPRG